MTYTILLLTAAYCLSMVVTHMWASRRRANRADLDTMRRAFRAGLIAGFRDGRAWNPLGRPYRDLAVLMGLRDTPEIEEDLVAYRAHLDRCFGVRWQDIVSAVEPGVRATPQCDECQGWGYRPLYLATSTCTLTINDLTYCEYCGSGARTKQRQLDHKSEYQSQLRVSPDLPWGIFLDHAERRDKQIACDAFNAAIQCLNVDKEQA